MEWPILQCHWHKFLSGFAMFGIGLLAACGTPREASTLQVTTVIPSSTLTPTDPSPTPTLSRRQYDTVVAENRAQVATEVAGSPTWTPGPPLPTDTPEPTPTWEMGLQGCTNANTYIPQQYTCWRGIVNGELVGVASGQGGMAGDRTQGLIMIFHGPRFNPTLSTTEIYSTPLKLGAVRIVSVDGTLFTLALVDVSTPGVLMTPWASATPGVTFVFDLTTRQWVSLPSPSAQPSPSLPPLPTYSALPTVLP